MPMDERKQEGFLSNLDDAGEQWDRDGGQKSDDGKVGNIRRGSRGTGSWMAHRYFVRG